MIIHCHSGCQLNGKNGIGYNTEFFLPCYTLIIIINNIIIIDVIIICPLFIYCLVLCLYVVPFLLLAT